MVKRVVHVASAVLVYAFAASAAAQSRRCAGRRVDALCLRGVGLRGPAARAGGEAERFNHQRLWSQKWRAPTRYGGPRARISTLPSRGDPARRAACCAQVIELGGARRAAAWQSALRGGYGNGFDRNVRES